MWGIWKALRPVAKGITDEPIPEASGLEYTFGGSSPLIARKAPVPTLAQAEVTFERRLADVQAALTAMKAASPEDKAARCRDVAKAVQRVEGPFAQLIELIENPLQK